jgi:hypothetical protein
LGDVAGGARAVLRVAPSMALMRSLSLPRPLGPLSFAALVGLVVAGCGRKATRDDCDIIVDRNVEVMLKSQGTVDPAVIAKRKDEMRSEVRDRIDQCVGKRVTDREIACIKTAETSDQIDKCLR